ncbi:MAG: hypothetical protein WBP72_11740 [Rhodocyclaceae bacterium]
MQTVESHRQDCAPRQRVIATLGRLDELTQIGRLKSLLASGTRYGPAAMVLSAYERGEMTCVSKTSIRPTLIFERLWRETGIAEVLQQLATQRR